MSRPTDYSRCFSAMADSGDPVELADKINTDRPMGRASKGGSTAESMAEARLSDPDSRKKKVAETLRAIAKKQDLNPEQRFIAEAIILPDLRPAIYVLKDSYGHVDHAEWQALNTNATWRKTIEAAIRSAGRVELPYRKRDDIYAGSGFVVGNGIVMTNRHVAEIFASGLGDKDIQPRSGRNGGFNLKRERDEAGKTLKVERVLMIHPYWDCALLEVTGLPAAAKPLRFSDMPPEDLASSRRKIASIGYPAFDPRNPEDVQDDLFDGIFQVKRLQPGLVQPVMNTSSFGKSVPVMTHDCSTLGGNSGSCLVDLETGDIVGLHFGGSYKEQNYAVPASALASDPRLHDAGVMFKSAVPAGPPSWSEYWTIADGIETTPPEGDSSAAAAGPPAASTQIQKPSQGDAGMTSTTTPDGGVTITIPLHVTVRLGTPGTGAAAVSAQAPQTVVAAESVTTEKMMEPFRDEDYSSRKGYSAGFLVADGTRPAELKRFAVPMPEARDKAVLAKLTDGGTLLRYQNFSIVMHAKRRLALFTASNVTAAPELRKPEKGKSYTRKGLSGLGENDMEKWFGDSRLGAEFQLPDHFYQYDDKTFDKGHIVRRDDAAWGETYEALRRANGDTYHVTNCSPQVKGFNQSAQGEDNWGDLENTVLSQAASERLCVLAGPVLVDSDPFVLGRMPGRVRLKVQIPTRFWKVIAARGTDGLEVFAFILEQDLDAVQTVTEGLEFAPEEFARFMVPLSDIEAAAGVVFDQALHRADQIATVRGAEIAHRAEARKK